ncbi:MAG: hypothetical protein QE278_08195 [Limnobacter sp.]|nr:hypothetical protein [Limnobacter sp.]
MKLEFSPGIYTLRTNQATELALNLSSFWLLGEQFQQFKSVLWISLESTEVLHPQVMPLLESAIRHPRGFNLISIKNSIDEQKIRGGSDHFTDMLSSLLVFSPSLILVEGLDHWLGAASEPLLNRNPILQTRYLRKWCRETRTAVISIVDGELPIWSGFCDGLADVSVEGSLLSEPWWNEGSKFVSTLWNRANFQCTPDNTKVLKNADFDNVGTLAKAVYQHRFVNGDDRFLRVETSTPQVYSKAPVLIRLGADQVALVQSTAPTLAVADTTPTSALPDGDASFTSTLQETFTPGQLTAISTEQFAIHGIMLLDLSRTWGVYCSLSRMSLMPHINASQAGKMLDLANLQSCVTITSDAFYFFRFWPTEPQEEALYNWLSSCFQTPIQSLFVGQVHYTDERQQLSVLRDISLQKESITLVELDLGWEAAPDISKLWQEGNFTEDQRLWMQRMRTLLKLEGQTE